MVRHGRGIAGKGRGRNEIHGRSYHALQEYYRLQFESQPDLSLVKRDLLDLYRSHAVKMGALGLPVRLREAEVRASDLGKEMVRLIAYCQGGDLEFSSDFRDIEDEVTAHLELMSRRYSPYVSREILWEHVGRYNSGRADLFDIKGAEAPVVSRMSYSLSSGARKSAAAAAPGGFGVPPWSAPAPARPTGQRRKKKQAQPKAAESSNFFENGHRFCRMYPEGRCHWPVATNSRGDLKCYHGIHVAGGAHQC